MAAGKSGYLDFPGGQAHTVRLFWEEDYDAQANTSVVKITDAKLRSGTYYGLWYPSRTIKVANQTLVTMSGNAPATHYWSVTAAGGTFHPIITNSGAAPPWQTSAIAHNPDGTLTVAVSVDLLLYRDSPSVISTTLSGTQYVQLTTIPIPKTLTFSNDAHSWVTVKKNGTTLTSGATVYYGDTLNIAFGATPGYEVSATLNGAPIQSGATHTVTGDVSIAVTSEAKGLVYIDTGAGLEAYQVFIDNGSAFEQYAPYVDNGSAFELCS